MRSSHLWERYANPGLGCPRLSGVHRAEYASARGLIMNMIILRGMLFGKGREAECEIVAWKGTPDSGQAYSQMRVVEAPNDLADGEYALRVDGVDAPTKKTHGIWEMVTFDS
jgi:hypothetical protein